MSHNERDMVQSNFFDAYFKGLKKVGNLNARLAEDPYFDVEPQFVSPFRNVDLLSHVFQPKNSNSERGTLVGMQPVDAQTHSDQTKALVVREQNGSKRIDIVTFPTNRSAK